MVTPMIMTIIGKKIPETKRSGTIGLIIASTPMLSTLMGLTITQILSRGWKTAYLLVVFPITFISLVLATLGLPRISNDDEKRQPQTSIKEGFRRILGQRSALACLLGTVMARMAWGGVMWYMVSFYRQAFELPTDLVGVIWSANTFVFVIGSLLVGRVVPRVGRKKTTGLMSLLIGIFIVVFTNLPSYYASVAAVLLVTIFSAVWSSSSNELSLIQVPEYSGAMMSLNSGSSMLGNALGTAIGGLCLTSGGYNLFGLVLGSVSIVAFLTISLFARDPVSTIFN
jgi:predicted MFS family arabinose efflux permease